MVKEGHWKNIENLADYYITYLLYREGKDLKTIGKIRRMSLREVEADLLKAKMSLSAKEAKTDSLVELISLPKSERMEALEALDEECREELIEEIYKRYISFKNPEDRMILIWLIGELKAERLLPFLKMELLSNKVNYRRLSCSALGKIKNKESKSWLEERLEDENPQVRQYAINALAKIGDRGTITLLEARALDDSKDYVRRSAVKAIDKIKKL